MRWRRLRPVGGAFIGSVAGAVIGLVAGGAVAAQFLPDPPDDGLAPHEAGPVGVLVLLVDLSILMAGALAGVAVGAVGGAVLGSWVGTRSMRGRPAPPLEFEQSRGSGETDSTGANNGV